MRVIQAGVGGFGGSWLYAVRDSDAAEHVALVDPNQEALRSAGELVGVPPDRQFAQLDDALAAVTEHGLCADGLIDVTPAPCHQCTSVAAIQAGLHVLVEKPLSDTLAGGQAMVVAACRNDRVLMVTQQYRYQDQPRAIKGLIDQGAIGELDHAVVEFQVHGLLFGWRQRMAQPFLMDMAVHHFDLMRYLFGRNAVRVTAQTWNPGFSNTLGDMSAFAWIDFERSLRVSYSGSYAAPGQDTGWNGRWAITGSTGSIVWNQRDEWGPIRIFRQTADLSQYQEMHFFTPLPEPWGEPIWAESIGPTGHHYDLYHWRACIEQHVEPETSGRDNLHTLALAIAATESAAAGGPLKVRSQFDCC